MLKKIKLFMQDIHYSRKKANFPLDSVLSLGEIFYKFVINTKNFLYQSSFLKEEVIPSVNIICVGNLTTGGVGKTPIVLMLANNLSKTKKTAIISRGYGAKLSNKIPRIIKDETGLRYKDGMLCGDEPFQLAKNSNDNIMVITCSDRKKSINLAKEHGCEVIISDDGFSNRKVKKTKNIILIDSKMRFGNGHLLPKGPLREPVSAIKRADEIILIDKDDKNIDDALAWAKFNFSKEISVCKMLPKKIYSALTKAEVKSQNTSAIAFCAIGQSSQFYNYVQKFYKLRDTVSFCDHHKYTKNDINLLIKLAKEKKTNTFITTQKDESKILPLISDIKDYNFNVLELEPVMEEIK